MNRSYLLGLSIVVSVVLASAALCLQSVSDRPASASVPAGETLATHPQPLGAFQLTERSNRTITQDDLADRVWIADFIFTRCPSSCPRITSVMKGLQGKLADSPVQLVSVSVDPGHDTPQVLSEYAQRFGADPERWWFLTGPRDDVYRLILDQFRVPVGESTEEERSRGAEAVSHSQKLVLLDRGNQIVGYFNAEDPEALERLIAQARRLVERPSHTLPTVNAGLNGLCAMLLVTALVLVRSGKPRAHQVCMMAALAVSALFLACYLYYHFVVVKGSVAFQGYGRGVRLTYFTILLSHTILAMVALPLIIMTVVRAFRQQFEAHRRIAAVTFPIWLYVSVTGVVVYWMLYQMQFPPVPSL